MQGVPRLVGAQRVQRQAAVIVIPGQEFRIKARRVDAVQLGIHRADSGRSGDAASEGISEDGLENRLQEGMVEEVKALLDEGVSEEFMVKLGLEYKYLTWYLTGKIGYEQMKEELASAIKKFAKRQMTWFRRDPRIHWLDMSGDPVAEASELIEGFIRQ